MTKVCHITSVHGSEDVRIFHKECVSLARNGYMTYLVQRGESYEKNGVHVIGFGEVTGGRLKRMTQVARRAYRAALAVDADIYHFHDPELLPYGIKLKRKGKVVVFDSHENYVEQIKSKYYLPIWCRSAVAFCYGMFERQVLRKIDGLIYPCLKNGEHPFEGQCRHITTLHNYPLLEELYDHYDAHAEKWKRSLCCPGSLSYIRGITHLVQASSSADAILYLAGNFSPTEYKEELLSTPEGTCVRYLGQLDRKAVSATLQHCQIGVSVGLNVGQYNKYDTLSTKAYEFMAMGLPVILGKCPYHEKIIKKYQCGICVDPENIPEFAAAIRFLLDHPEEAQQMGENGRKAVKEEFNWGVEEKKLFALYDEILKDYTDIRKVQL